MWREEDILVTVKAYPNPSKRHRETSCVAGVQLSTRSWIRLHPIPFRLLPDPQRFRKYDVIRASVRRSSDPRPESHRVNLDGNIECIDHIGTQDKWLKRNELLRPIVSSSVEELWEAQTDRKSLGLVRVRKLNQLEIVPQEGGWRPEQLQRLQTRRLFDREIITLECPEFAFYYHFLCEGSSCRGHRMKIVDWEVIQAFRDWRKRYGQNWEAKFRERFETWMAGRDLHLYVGTMLRFPSQWIIIGLYYPPRTVT